MQSKIKEEVGITALYCRLSCDDEKNELSPFRNIMNKMYSRDISRKIRSSHRLIGNAG